MFRRVLLCCLCSAPPIRVLGGAPVAAPLAVVQGGHEGTLLADLDRLETLAQTMRITAMQSEAVTLRAKDSSNQVHDQNYKTRCTQLDLSKANRVIAIDEERLIAHVEPMCTMDTLLRATLKHGLVPKVLPEFKSITVGGAVMGGALESSSHRHGQFHDCCAYLTIMLGSGELVTCSPTQQAELFDAVSGSYGTLGLLLRAGVELQRCKPLVRVRYRAFRAARDGVGAMLRECQGPGAPEFVEGIQYPGGEGSSAQDVGPMALMTAEFSDGTGADKALRKTRLTRPWGLWYYEHVQLITERLLKRHAEHQVGAAPPGAAPYHEELVPIYDYMFRYERGAFWMARPMSYPGLLRLTPMLAMFLLVTDRNLLSRLLFRWLFTAHRLYRSLHMASSKAVAERFVVCDLYVPEQAAAPLVEYARTTVPITTPIWLCPVRGPKRPQALSPHGHCRRGGLMVNVGLYGRVRDDKGFDHTRRLEHWIHRNGGRKMLYSQHTWSAEDLWETGGYDRAAYLKLRDKYQANGRFPSLEDKICHTSWAEDINPAALGTKLQYRLSRLLL